MKDMIHYKTVGKNGQISIGKEWAGRLVKIIPSHEGLNITPGDFIPEHQQVFFTPEAQEQLEAFNQWSTKTPPQKSPLQMIKKKMRGKK